MKLLLFCFGFLLSTATPGQETHKESRPAPYFILPTWEGKVLKSTSLKGQVVVLDFFQTWCPDCQQSAPQLEKLYKRYKDQGLVVVGISHDKEGAKAIEAFVKKYEVTYPVLIGDISIAVSYIGITPQKSNFRIPFIILIDRKGDIVGQFEEGTAKEAMDIKLLEERIKKLL